jgi:hypothetical protein
VCCVCYYFVNFLKKKKKKSLHSAFERIIYVRACTRGCVQTHLRVFDRSTPSHTHTLMHACIRTYPASSNAELTRHTCTQHECGRTHLHTFERTRAETSHDLFLGHCSSLFPSFQPAPYSGSPSFSISPPPKHP